MMGGLAIADHVVQHHVMVAIEVESLIGRQHDKGGTTLNAEHSCDNTLDDHMEQRWYPSEM